MNLIPVVVTGAVIAAVPPLRKRVMPVATATYVGATNVVIATAKGLRDVAESAIDGAVDVGTVALRGPESSETSAPATTQKASPTSTARKPATREAAPRKTTAKRTAAKSS